MRLSDWADELRGRSAWMDSYSEIVKLADAVKTRFSKIVVEPMNESDNYDS